MLLWDAAGGCATDGRCSALSTNQDDFLTTTGWLEITSTEYTSLGSNLTGVSFAGASDAEISALTITSSGLTNGVFLNGYAVALNDWLVAIKVKITSIDNANIKWGAHTVTSGLIDISGNLPEDGTGTTRYYVYNGDEQNTIGDAVPAIYNAAGTYVGTGTAGLRYYGSGNNNTISGVIGSATVGIQMLTVDTKQW